MKNQQINLKIIIWGWVEIIFLIIMIFVFTNLLKKDEYNAWIQIDNLSSQNTSISEDNQKGIAAALYLRVAKNTVSTKNISNSGAIVRDNSFTESYDQATNLYIDEFIVDLPELQQSYKVWYDWSTDKDNKNLSSTGAIISCLEEDDLIYDDFGCKDMNTQYKARSSAIQLAIPYEGKENDFTTYELSISDQDRKRINATIYACNDSLYEQRRQDAQNYLNNSGIDFSIYSVLFLQACTED